MLTMFGSRVSFPIVLHRIRGKVGETRTMFNVRYRQVGVVLLEIWLVSIVKVNGGLWF